MPFSVNQLEIHAAPGIYRWVLHDDETQMLAAYGDGSPEGVIDAPAGSEYVDRTTGHWYFKQGSGTTGWRRLVGLNSDGELDVDPETLEFIPQVNGTGVLVVGGMSTVIPLANNTYGGLLSAAGFFKLSQLSVSAPVDLDAMVDEVVALRQTLGGEAGDVDLDDSLSEYVTGSYSVTAALVELFERLETLATAIENLENGSEPIDLSTITSAITTLQNTTASHTSTLGDHAEQLDELSDAVAEQPTQQVVAEIADLPGDPKTGDIYVVVDATADPRITAGSAGYIWDGSEYILFGTSEGGGGGGGGGGEGEISMFVGASTITLIVGESSVTLPAATTASPGLLRKEDKFKLDSLRSYTTRIGDGVATTFDVTHNFGTVQVQVTVTHDPGDETATGEVIYPKIRRFPNHVTVTFALPPATDEYLVEVQTLSKTSGSLLG